MNYTYKTETDKKGNAMRYRCWKEGFKNEDTGEVIYIQRQELIKVNGQNVRWYSWHELRNMSKAERKAIQVPMKK